MNLPAVHLAILQPVGYVHSLGFLDQARYFRHQFRRMGAEVTLGKNRLREDAVNFVFGAHLGFPQEWTRRHACIFVQLEQLGHGGARVNAPYLDLLRRNAVVDYDAANVASYATQAADVPLVPFLHAPYLHAEQSPPLEERPIDLLFFGSMNDRRRNFFEQVEASGVSISIFDHAIYSAERDHYIRQAKAVLNCHFYETSRFEQARAFQCLSLGTPVVSERSAQTQAPAAFEQAVFWLDHTDPAAFFRQQFVTAGYYASARAKLDAFRRIDPIEAYADLLAFAAGFGQAHARTRPPEAWKPTRVNLGSGKDYKPGWLNIDILERAEPDLVLDLGQPVQLPLELPSCSGGQVRLEPGQLDTVYANNVLEQVPVLPQLMSNVLALLKEDGRFLIEVPYEHALTAWQDPTHLRALNENSWLHYTDWFWYAGWFEHRFKIAECQWLDMKLQPCAKEQAAFMKVDLRKVATTVRERTLARAMRPDFGGVDDDLDDDTAACAADTPATADETLEH